MTNQKDPNSKRSQRRANRNFTVSRPERRALDRLTRNLAVYNPSDPSSKKPGAKKHW